MSRPVSQKEPPLKCVVAVGGSAGALEAFESFLKALPADVNAAFVILQHMDPHQKSLLPELLANMTSMPVVLAKEGEILTPRHVYVSMPGSLLTVDKDRFVSRQFAIDEERRHPIDHFFVSLAANFGSHAIGIVLSGNGNDGTHGMRLIQEARGRTLAQKPNEAKFPGMPQSAIYADVVDKVMSASEMGLALSRFVECENSELSEIGHAAELERICQALYRHTGHDFSSYKKSTVARRVERRLNANFLPDLTTYLALLETDPAEAQALLKYLLISVTHFFRDPEAFVSLKEKVIPRIFDSVRPNEAVRVWVPACATGEEAYTLAILLKEQLRRVKREAQLQIFATDIDRAALEHARAGYYPLAIAENVPADLLDRYFKEDEGGYRASQELREICIFSEHSLLKNPPFSRIDLISCRNLFIYWEPELQNRVLPLFHYALSREGFLFLGPAENTAANSDLFKPIDKKHRIFQRNPSARSGHLFFNPSRLGLPARSAADGQKVPALGDRDASKAISSALLEDFAPPAFVINEQGEIVFYSGRTGKYLEPPVGEPSNVIYDLIRRPIRAPLHALIHKCVKSQAEVSHPSLTFENEGAVQNVRLTVRPMNDVAHGLFLVVLQENMPRKSKDDALREGITLTSQDSIVQQLEDELRDAREHLQSTIEEVKSSNEELLSMNEELQSANEELQTSKEELQSTNEELETVNAELSKKVEELDDTNSDLQNFFNSAHIPIVFLDREFRIQRFTPTATRIFRLIPGDVGRTISDIASYLEVDDLSGEFTHVLESLQPVERQVQSKDGRSHFIMRVSPYRTINNVIDGVIASFSDVTELKRAQESKSMLAAIVQHSFDAIIARDIAGNVTSWNVAAESIFLFKAEEAVGRPISQIIPPDKLEEFKSLERRVLHGEIVQNIVTERVRKDGLRISVSKTMSPVIGEDGRYLGLSVIYRDITELRRVQETQRKLAAIVQHTSDAIIARDLEGRITSWNAGAERIFQFRADEAVGKPITLIIPPDKRDEFKRLERKVIEGDVVQGIDTERVRRDGQRISVSKTMSPILDDQGKPMGLSVIYRDISAKKHAEAMARKSLDQLVSTLESMGDAFFSLDSDWKITRVNSNQERLSNTRREDTLGRVFWDVFPTARKSKYWPEYHRVMKERVPARFEEYYEPLKLWTQVDAYPVQDGGISVFFRDVTETKTSEQRLEEANEQFRTLADAMPNLAWIAKADGFIYWYNRRWYEYTGTRPEDMEGWGWQNVHDPQELPKVLERWKDSIATGNPFDMTFPLKGADGTFRWFLTRVTPLKNARGEVVRWFGTNTDVDEQRRVREELRAAVSTRDEFLSIASHELKTPLTTLKIQTQMRKKSLIRGDSAMFDAEKLRKMVDGDERQINRITRLIDDMLDIARISSGRLTVNPERVDLGAVVREVCERLSDQLNSVGCALTIDATPGAEGLWDRFRIEQVVMNLVTNAMKYGSGKPIQVSVKADHERVILRVQDAGIGISKADHARIFQQFERAVDRSEVSGLGLGLYIVRQILEAHGGTIRVESELGQGATFVVELPVNRTA